jgi:regulator of CtrA degradation
MSHPSAEGAGPVSFAERLANSEAFGALFRDGMALVEETAAYLDGSGRQQSRQMDRQAGLAYATESMRLTTRLMQLASWLLLHRSVREGEMSLSQASKEKTKVKLSAGEPGDESNIALLPDELRGLIARAQAMHLQIIRLDATIHAETSPAPNGDTNPVERQLKQLKAAFEGDGTSG